MYRNIGVLSQKVIPLTLRLDFRSILSKTVELKPILKWWSMVQSAKIRISLNSLSVPNNSQRTRFRHRSYRTVTNPSLNLNHCSLKQSRKGNFQMSNEHAFQIITQNYLRRFELSGPCKGNESTDSSRTDDLL